MYDAFAYVKNNGIALRNTYRYDYSAKARDCRYVPSDDNHFRNLGMVEYDGNTNI